MVWLAGIPGARETRLTPSKETCRPTGTGLIVAAYRRSCSIRFEDWKRPTHQCTCNEENPSTCNFGSKENNLSLKSKAGASYYKCRVIFYQYCRCISQTLFDTLRGLIKIYTPKHRCGKTHQLGRLLTIRFWKSTNAFVRSNADVLENLTSERHSYIAYCM